MKDHHMRTARPIWLNFFRCAAPVFIYKDQHEGFIYTYQHIFTSNSKLLDVAILMHNK